MGQINLFTASLSDAMQDFLTTYRDGELRSIGAIRLLDDTELPHVELRMDTLEYSYLLIEAAPPLTKDDVKWVYRSIIAKQWPFERSTVMRYCIERTLHDIDAAKVPPSPKPRRRIESDAEWDQVRYFRRHLEAPAIAFRHYNKTDKDTHLSVKWYGSILVIEYDAELLPMRPYASRGA